MPPDHWLDCKTCSCSRPVIPTGPDGEAGDEDDEFLKEFTAATLYGCRGGAELHEPELLDQMHALLEEHDEHRAWRYKGSVALSLCTAALASALY